MGYREERDALRAKTEGLEQDLASARGELGRAQEELQRAADPRRRIEQLERDLAAAQRVLGELRAEIQGPPPRPVSSTRVAIFGGLAALTVIVPIVVTIFVFRASGEAPVAPAAGPPPPPRALEPAPEEDDKPAPPPRRTQEARWAGTVKRAQGFPVGAGARCEVRATLSSDGASMDVKDIDVTCGDRALHRSRDKLSGMSMRGAEVKERLDRKAGTLRYTLAYDDTGDRAGEKSQISLSTEAKQARIWRATVPSFEVELTLDELSAPVTGPPLVGAPPAAPKGAVTGPPLVGAPPAAPKGDDPLTTRR